MSRVVFSPGQSLIEEIRSAARRHAGGRARIAVAWARDEGVGLLLQALSGRLTRLEVIVGLNERGTTVEALLRLLPHTQVLRAFFKHPRQTFHHKLYWFDGGATARGSATLIVGSSNLTRGGLLTNFEASLISRVTGRNPSNEDRALLKAVAAEWGRLTSAPFSSLIETPERIRELYQSGYLVLERMLRRRQREAGRAAVARGDLPTAPPPHTPPLQQDPLEIPFDLLAEDEETPSPEEGIDPQGALPLADRFFVRTLTANDVEKLHGRTPGTFEPDLGETARNRFPGFWGWPDHYEVVVRNLRRREWKTAGRLISALTPAEGISVTATLWYREERPGHAAEHRLGLGPIGEVRTVVPDDFDTTSLLIVERAAQGAAYRFIIRLITASQPGYEDFATFLTAQRPHHRFGYGP